MKGNVAHWEIELVVFEKRRIGFRALIRRWNWWALFIQFSLYDDEGNHELDDGIQSSLRIIL